MILEGRNAEKIFWVSVTILIVFLGAKIPGGENFFLIIAYAIAKLLLYAAAAFFVLTNFDLKKRGDGLLW